MSSATLLLILILLLGILGNSNIIAAAATILLLVQFVDMPRLFPILERRGLELGLLFLVISVLVPFAAGKVPASHIFRSFFSWPGLIAIVSGALATHLNSQGLDLLKDKPQLMIGLVIGSIIGIVFLGGIPVGPLMAGGIAALLVKLFGMVQ